jgi:hypothetical protein
MTTVPIYVLAGQSNAEHGGIDKTIVTALQTDGGAFEFVKTALGGTSLFANSGMDWDPHSANELFVQLIEDVAAAKANAVNQGQDTSVVLFWVQGEADTGMSQEAYRDQLTLFFESFRANTDADAIIYISSLPYDSTVRRAQYDVAGALSNTFIVDTTGAHTFDGVHYTQESHTMIANKFLDAYPAALPADPDYKNLVPKLSVTEDSSGFVIVNLPTYQDNVYSLDDRLARVQGGSGWDTINTGHGFATVFSGDGDDVIRSGGGGLSVDAGGDNDTVYGSSDGDFILGRSGDDLIYGADGNDTVGGGDQNDRIDGGDGNDNLYGENGNDILEGGAGFDFLSGGADIDLFRGTVAELQGDTIADFSIGERLQIVDSSFASFAYVRFGNSLEIGSTNLSLSDPGNPGFEIHKDVDGTAQLLMVQRDSHLNDFNGDGHADLLWQSVRGGTLTTWSVSGNGAGEARILPNSAELQLEASAKAVGSLDWNGDGAFDVLARSAGGNFSVWDANANGGFTKDYIDSTVSTQWKISAIGDFNGDGRDDLAWRNSETGSFTTWSSTGSSFANNTYTDDSVSKAWSTVGSLDWNGDGLDDILWRNDGGEFTIWEGTENGFVVNAYDEKSVSSDWRVEAMADLTGDGRSDLVWRNATSGEMTVWTAVGTGFEQNTYIDSTISLNWTISQAADLNADGLADLVFRNIDSGVATIWHSTGEGFIPNVAEIASVGLDWTLIGQSGSVLAG